MIFSTLKEIIKKKRSVLIWSFTILKQQTKRYVYNFDKWTFDIFDKRSKFYYVNLLHEKFQPPYYQYAINKLFDIEREYWKDIYEGKVKNMFDKILKWILL